MKTDRILITRTDRIGDVVLSTPVIRFMRKLYPSAHIAMMVRPYTREIIVNDPGLDEVIVYDKYYRHKSLWGTIKFAFELRKKHFDMILVLHPTNRMHITAFLAGVPVRIGYDRKMGKLLTIKVPHKKQEGALHESAYNFRLLEAAGFNIDGADKIPYLVTGEQERRSIDAILSSRGTERDILVVHAGASCPSKRWPAERFAGSADMISEEFNTDVILVGGKDAVEYNSQVAENMKKNVFDLTDELSVGETAELIRRAILLVSNDSGPVHIATAVRTPVISIFGRSDPGLSPERWGPLGEKDIALHKDVGCEKCLAHNCTKGFICLKAVTVEDVLKAARSILK